MKLRAVLDSKLGQVPVPLTQAQRDEKAREIAHKVFLDLKRMNQERSSTLIFVYLPTIWELNGNSAPGQVWSRPEEWLKFSEQESKALGVPFINLFGQFQ